MSLNRFIILIGTILVIILQFSCKNLETENDKNTVYIHIPADPGHLNPITSNEATASTINEHIYETLLERDYDTLDLIPQLAESWSISPDNMRFRFRIKKGVLWSDGVELTADDIIYSFQRIKDPKVACAPLKVYYIDVKNVNKIDRYTVEFQYSKLYFRALDICGSIPIVPKHIFDNGTDFNKHNNNRFPIGTGPYKFEQWSTGKKLVLVLNDKYWGKSPEIKKIVYKIIPEPSVALQMLKKGEMDVMSVRPIQWVRQTNSQKFLKNFYKLQYPSPNYSFIGWNARKPAFSDRRVRTALTLMINRDAILDKLLFGIGEIVSGTVYIKSKYYNKNVKPWPYDPAKARELLKSAGWIDHDGDGILDKDGKKFSFTFTISSGSKFAERLGTIIKEDFAKAGIEMDINRFEWAVFVQKLNKKDFDAVVLSWSLGWEDDPYQLWHSSQTRGEGASNFCGFENREADQIIEKIRSEFDDNRRVKLFYRFHEILHEEQPYTFLYCNPALAVVSKRFDKVKVHTRGLKLIEWKPRGNNE